MERERILEYLVAMIFLVLIFIMILIGLSINTFKPNSSTTISNSYNNIEVSQPVQTVPKVQTNTIYYRERYIREKDYRVWSEHDTNRDWDYYGEKYIVHIYNDGPSRYFTIRFYFEDYSGKVRSYDMRKYIFAGEEEKFYFNDYTRDRDYYYDWDYRVLY
ncbi:MAG: hypothetical protein KC516_04440 [Nanoarchaeota archaeon]|nr:hypothetical protein [Nanoarchaeota archaeon]